MQDVFDFILAGFSALLGFLLNAVWQAVKDLQKADMELTRRVSEIEVLVAGTYIKREEFERNINRLFEKLEHIESKLDKKADK